MQRLFQDTAQSSYQRESCLQSEEMYPNWCNTEGNWLSFLVLLNML